MLKELRIKNFAIVKGLSVSFNKGLNVITGETGAGKSIVVKAIEMLLGGRASAEIVSSGAEDAHITGVFEISDSAFFKEQDIPEDEYLIVRRIVSKSGKSRAYLNDAPVTMTILSKALQDLVDIHGQHEHQRLLNPASQRMILDEFGGLQGLREEVSRLYRRYREIESEMESIKTRERERAQRIDLLNYQIREIDEASLCSGEKDELVKEHSILVNLSKLRELAESSIYHLKEGGNALLDSLGEIIKNVDEISRHDSSSEEIKKLLKEAGALLEEAFYLFRDLRERYEIDPGRVEFVEKRLDQIEKLERKYGEGIEGILRYRDEAAKELEGLMNIEESLEALKGEYEAIKVNLHNCVERLSVERKKTAQEIEKKMKGVLSELAFQNPAFEVDIKDTGLSSWGKDHVEFLFSANPGQSPMPLSKIASGGELSRVMLALKSIFADVDMVPVVIFDEIDAGVGGKTADYVGKRIKELSKRHQVLCITHLPQLAARADHHINITKKTNRASTEVMVKVLDDKERIEEIARMLSGSVTKASLKHAEELINAK